MSDVLRLISANPGDLPKVLDGILVRAAALTDADGGTITIRHGDRRRIEAVYGIAADFMGIETAVAEMSPKSEAAIAQHAPMFTDDAMVAGYGIPQVDELIRIHNIRSMVNVALILDGEFIGTLVVSRKQVRPFDQRSGQVLQAFADQASIAIANARLR